MGEIDGVLLDIDGVLAISWEPIPGAIETLRWMRASGIPFRLITNTTTKTRADLARTLRDAGFDVRDDELVTAVVATAEYLRTNHPGAECFLLSDGDARDDLEGIELVDVEDAEVIVIGGASEDFAYSTMNRIFRRLMDGAALVGMHRNLYWKTSGGWSSTPVPTSPASRRRPAARPRSAASRRRPTSTPRSRCSVCRVSVPSWSATTS